MGMECLSSRWQGGPAVASRTLVTMPTVEGERARREAMWADLQAAGDPSRLSPQLLRELGIYGGAQGIWVDAERTRGIDGGGGITVSLLHTGRHYADELSTDGVLYHYPRTGRPPGRDRSEVDATKAGRLRLPVFVITPGPTSSSRSVHKGWIEGWDDDAELFLVTFFEDPRRSRQATMVTRHLYWR